jgi:hypothetical protein
MVAEPDLEQGAVETLARDLGLLHAVDRDEGVPSHEIECDGIALFRFTDG